MKIPSVTESPDAWNETVKKPPQDVRELYIVVQRADSGELVRAAAYWEQDANNSWGWNKPGVTHWMKWPQMPK